MIARLRKATLPQRQSVHSERTDGATSARDPDEGIVYVGLPSLIALHRAAESLPLRTGRIRSLGAGGYRSPFKGRGMEFDEVRPYMQGDDVRTLDWRVIARTGKPYTKLFREERERAVVLWVDLHPSMFFATQGAYKAVRAAQAAAILGWSAVFHGDRVGALVFSENDHVELRPKRGKVALLLLLRKLAEHSAWQRRTRVAQSAEARDAWNQSLLRLRRVAQPGSMVILLSDFSGLDEQGSALLSQLAHHCDIVLADIHDPLESELPPAGHYRVSNGERIVAMQTDRPTARERYRQAFQQRAEERRQLCRRYGMTSVSLSTVDEPLVALQRGFGIRA